MYRIRRVDANQKSIISQFRLLRCKVFVLSEIGRGCPDILVAIPVNHSVIDQRYLLTLIEIKDGKKPPSARKLTPHEKKFHEEWKGMVFIIENDQDVIKLVNSVQGNV